MLNQQVTLLGADTTPLRWYQTGGGLAALGLGVFVLGYLTYRMVR